MDKVIDIGNVGGHVPSELACGVCSRNTSEELLVILEFTHFSRICKFESNGPDYKNKVQIDGIKVRIAI